MPPTPSVELVTVPNVELCTVGTFDTSTGTWTFTVDDLAAACAAYDDPGYRTPTLKLGHIDPRFDGEPAVGRIENVRLSADRMTLLGDYVGVPKWLAEALPSAYPDRSIEAQFGLVTCTGTRHRFALTAVALLGVSEPAIATLADVAELFTQGIAASAPPRLVQFRASGGKTVSPRQDVRAAVSIDDVRNAFYDQIRDSPNPWAWIRECWVGDGAFLIVDNDEGELYRIPWTEANGSVSFGEPEEVVVQYVPAPPDQEDEEEQNGLVLLARNVPLTTEEATMTPEQLAELGLPADATPEQIAERSVELGAWAAAERAALQAQIDAAQPPTDPSPDPAPAPAPTVELPDGFVAMPQSAVDELVSAARAVPDLQKREHERQRSAFLARYESKFTPAQRGDMERIYDESGADVLASLLDKSPDIVPTRELGHGDEGVSSADDAIYAELFGKEG